MTDRDRLIEILKNCIEENIGVNDPNVTFEVDYENIADYLLANGVIVPPCKVGDKVYYFSHRPFNLSILPNTIYEADVVRIVTTRLGTSVVIQIRNEYGCTEIPQASSFGQSVFLTKEEAEAKLKEREG